MQFSLHMRYLDLSHNEFGEAAGEVLGPAIGESKTSPNPNPDHWYIAGDSETIQTLDLSWNHLRKKGALAIAEGLKVKHFF